MTSPVSPGLGRDGRLVLIVVVVAALALAALVAAIAAAQMTRYEAALDGANPRIARLAGVLEASDEITAALDVARGAAARYAYPSDLESARAASDFQTRIRDVFQAAGMNVVGTQQFPARDVEGMEEISLGVSAQGSLEQLRGALAALRNVSPVVRVEQIRLQPVVIAATPDQNPPQQLNVQARFMAIRMKGA